MLSYVLPIRNDYPHATWTLYSFINDVPKNEEFEIIVIGNGLDEESRKWLEWLSKCRMARHCLRIIFSEEVGLWPNLRRGFREAKGDFLLWGCSHIAIQRDTLTSMRNLLRKEKGIVHSPMLWMGDWVPNNTWKLYSYKDPVYRGWTFKRFSDKPYTICSSGAGLSMIHRDEFDRLGGIVEPNLTIVGGGETFMDLKAWLLGSKVWVHPDALYWHWAYNRNWHADATNTQMRKEGQGWNEYIMYNQLIALWTLGGDKWIKKIYGEKLLKYKLYKEYYEKIKNLCTESRKYILDNQVYDGLDGLFNAEPWSYPKKNRDENTVRCY